MVTTAVADPKHMQAYVLGFLVFAAATLLSGRQLWRIVALRVFGRTAAAVYVRSGKAEFRVPGRERPLLCDRSRYAARAGRNGKLEVVYYPRKPRICADKEELAGWLTTLLLAAFVTWTTAMCGLMIAEMAA